MFTVRPYPSNPSVLIHWSGAKMAEGEPYSLEMVGGTIGITGEPFTDPDGVPATLNPEEKAALAIMSAGMSEQTTQEWLGWSFEEPRGSVETLQRKLGVAGRAGAATIALAYEKQLLVGRRTPNIQAIRPANQEQFLQLGVMLGTNHPYSRINEAFGGGVPSVVSEIVSDVGLGDVEKPTQLLAALAGACKILPKYTDSESMPLETMLRIDTPTMARLFPKRSLWYAPLADDPYTVLRFSGQPTNQTDKPSMEVGGVDRIIIDGALIEVHNPFVDEAKTETLLTPQELAAFVFASLGMDRTEVVHETAINGRREWEVLANIFGKLLEPDYRKRHARYFLRTIGRAFDRWGIYETRQAPAYRGLSPFWKARLLDIGPHLAEGLYDDEIAPLLTTRRRTSGRPLSPGSVTASLRDLRHMTGKDTPALTLLAKANHVVRPITNEEIRREFTPAA